MRLFFGLLIVVNVVIFYFGSQWKNGGSKPVAEFAPDVGQLRLLSEIEKNKPVSEPLVSIPSYEVVVDQNSDQLPVEQRTPSKVELVPLTPAEQPITEKDAPATDTVLKKNPASEMLSVDIAEDPLVPSEPEETGPEVAITPPVERVLNSTEPAPVRDVEVGKEEVEQDSVDAVVEQPVVEPDVEPQQVCGALGTFAEGAEGRAAITFLQDAGIEASLRREEFEKASGFWVIIPAYASQDEARKAVERLRAKGIKDFRMFFKGERKNSISLGLFSSKVNAERRRAAVLKKGEKATIEPRIAKVEGFWVDFRGNLSAGEGAVKELLQKNPELKRDEYPCSRIVTNGGIF